MSGKMNSIIIELIVIGTLVAGGFALIFDWNWPKFKNFGTTPIHKAEPVRRLQGFGPQCDQSDHLVPCSYKVVAPVRRAQ